MPPKDRYDFVANDFIDLAEQLGVYLQHIPWTQLTP